MDQREAAHAVLIEVVNILGAFKENLVLVGGWVPDLIYPDKQHIGSLDVDLAISPAALGADVYTTILARLQEKDYTHLTGPTRFKRTVPGVSDPIKIDLISGEYVTEGKTKSIRVDELQLSCLRGIDLAFEHCQEITITGVMPDGSQNTVRARIASPETFILIKAFALSGRMKAKDAYDIAFVLHNYEPSLAAMAEKLAPLTGAGLGAEAYQILTEKFALLDSVGPTSAAEVARETGGDYAQARQAAFQDAKELFEQIRHLLA